MLMVKESFLDSDKVVYLLEDEDEEIKRVWGCVILYLVDECEILGKLFLKFC